MYLHVILLGLIVSLVHTPITASEKRSIRMSIQDIADVAQVLDLDVNKRKQLLAFIRDKFPQNRFDALNALVLPPTQKLSTPHSVPSPVRHIEDSAPRTHADCLIEETIRKIVSRNSINDVPGLRARLYKRSCVFTDDLCTAVLQENFDKVVSLTNAGTQLNTPGKRGFSPWMCASISNTPRGKEIAQYLLNHGAIPYNPAPQNHLEDLHPLPLAVKYQNDRVKKYATTKKYFVYDHYEARFKEVSPEVFPGNINFE